MKKEFLLNKYGKHLWTRDLARRIFQDVATEIAGLQEGDIFIIDVKGVEVFDYSFANELFGKILLNMPADYPMRSIIVENLTEYTRENLSKALESMHLAMIEKTGSKLQILGKVHPVDVETFKAIVKFSKPVTAAKLKEHFNINLTAVNERLTKLVQLGLICREKGLSPAGREQYVYKVLV